MMSIVSTLKNFPRLFLSLDLKLHGGDVLQQNKKKTKETKWRPVCLIARKLARIIQLLKNQLSNKHMLSHLQTT